MSSRSRLLVHWLGLGEESCCLPCAPFPVDVRFRGNRARVRVPQVPPAMPRHRNRGRPRREPFAHRSRGDRVVGNSSPERFPYPRLLPVIVGVATCDGISINLSVRRASAKAPTRSPRRRPNEAPPIPPLPKLVAPKNTRQSKRRPRFANGSISARSVVGGAGGSVGASELNVYSFASAGLMKSAWLTASG